MTREILPVFEGLENIQAAEALSEPFVRSQDYTVMPEENLGEVEPVAVGVAYISDAGEVEYAFVLSDETTAPYDAVQQFSEGYDRTIGFYHASQANMEADLGADPRLDATQASIIEKTKDANLRAISGFAIFASAADNLKLSGSFFLGTKIFEEIPLEARGEFFEAMSKPGRSEAADALLLKGRTGPSNIAEIRRAQKGVMQNDSSHQMYGVAMVALLLPETKAAKRLIAEDPRIGGFLALPRKERRKLIKAERKG